MRNREKLQCKQRIDWVSLNSKANISRYFDREKRYTRGREGIQNSKPRGDESRSPNVSQPNSCIQVKSPNLVEAGGSAQIAMIHEGRSANVIWLQASEQFRKMWAGMENDINGSTKTKMAR